MFSHGDHWGAIFDDVEKDVPRLLPMLLEKGRLVREAPCTLEGKDGVLRPETASALTWPETPLRYLALCVTDSGGPEIKRLLHSAYPVCVDGIETVLELDEVLNDDDPLEGYVRATTSYGAQILFFDPLFFRSAASYEPGRFYRFRLSGIARRIERAKTEFVEVRDGPMIKMSQDRLREEDPTADVSQIQSVRLNLKGSHLLFPSSDGPEYLGFSAPIEKLENIQVDGLSFVRLYLTLVDTGEDPPLSMWIYARSDRLGGYQPQVGEDVEGVIWMQGYCMGEDPPAKPS